jgi:DNA-binding NtrC family response regulator
MAITVLVVDDEQVFREALSERLRVRQLNVLTAESGEKALKLLRAHPVDVVILDVRMPGMDGLAATQAIKLSHPLVEVILLTGHASLDASREGMSLGAFDYLLKPIKIDELVYRIEDAHGKKADQEKKIRRLHAAKDKQRGADG